MAQIVRAGSAAERMFCDFSLADGVYTGVAAGFVLLVLGESARKSSS